MKKTWISTVFVFILLAVAQEVMASKNLGNTGTFFKWQKVEITLPGRQTDVWDNPNPFDINIYVIFRGPGGTFKVPAFYDGDGQGNYKGNIWKVRFSPNATGRWQFSSQSNALELNGYHGFFAVEACDNQIPPNLTRGRLEYVGKPYLKFADGNYWIKGGIDDPENFLGKAFGDWAGKKHAIDFFVSKGCNSIYVMTNTIRPGDSDDTWPWLGKTSDEAKKNSSRFDVKKLAQWEDFFNYCEKQGIVLHLVLLDDSAWHGFNHYLYYREIIARFGHHNNLYWNIGEEANEAYSPPQQLQNASLIRTLDAYHHPLTIHLGMDWPYLADKRFDLTSIQTRPGGDSDFTSAKIPDLNRLVSKMRMASKMKGRVLAVMIDEIPGISLVNDVVRYKFRSEVIYPIYLAGGGFELHYRDPYTQKNHIDYQALGPILEDMTRAREFIETLPFVNMRSHNELLILPPKAKGYCLAQPGLAYAIYLAQNRAVHIDLTGQKGIFSLSWYDVRTGKKQKSTILHGGGIRKLGPSPFTGDGLAILNHLSHR